MTLQRYRPNRPELSAVQEGVTRDSPAILTLSRIWADRGASQGQAWQESAFRWYQESLASWLGGKFPSKNTRDSYRATLLHFFDFATRLHARISATSPLTHPILAPHEVRESDIEAYVKFLKDGGTFVQPEMERDKTAQFLMIAITRARESLGRPVSPQEVLLFYRRLDGAPASDDEMIGHKLRELARKNVIDSTPRWRDSFVPILRADGQPTGRFRPPHPFEEIDPSIFKYLPVIGSGRMPSPATIAQRLSAVSSFFQHLLAEKPGLLGAKSPVVGNPVADQLKKATARAKQSRGSRTNARKTSVADFQLLMRLIARSGQPELIETRDKLAMVLLQGMGLRISELCDAQNQDVVIEQNDKGQNIHVLTVTGKGAKVRRLAMPARAQAAWEDYRYAILNSRKPEDWKIRATLDTAPIISAVARKGFTLIARPNDGDVQSMNPGSVREIFRRYIMVAVATVPFMFESVAASPDDPSQGVRDAVAAWIGPDSAAYARLSERERRASIYRTLTLRLHPHGLRHLFAQQGLASGIPIHVMSALLGHENVGTTMVYAPQQRTEHIRLDDISDSAAAYASPVTAAIIPTAQTAFPGQPPPAPAKPPQTAFPGQPVAQPVKAPVAPPKAAQPAPAPAPPAPTPKPKPTRQPAAARPVDIAHVMTDQEVIASAPAVPEEPIDVEKLEKKAAQVEAKSQSVGDTPEGISAASIAQTIREKIATHRGGSQQGLGVLAYPAREPGGRPAVKVPPVRTKADLYFIPNPLFAYSVRPVISRQEPNREIQNPIWTYQSGKDVKKTKEERESGDKSFLTGSQTLLPYFAMLSEVRDPSTADPKRLATPSIVPIPCMDPLLDIDRSGWETEAAEAYTKIATSGQASQARNYVKWVSFMMEQAAILDAAVTTFKQKHWILFGDDAQPRKEYEPQDTWKKRVRGTTIRAHNFEEGVLPWLRDNKTSYMGSFNPNIDPVEYFVDQQAEAAAIIAQKPRGHANRIGRWAFVPPIWLIMTEDPLGSLDYGVTIERRPEFAGWLGALLDPSRGARTAVKAGQTGASSQVYRAAIDNGLAGTDNAKRPTTPGGAVRAMLQALQFYAEDKSWLEQDSDIATINDAMKQEFRRLARDVKGWNGRWPGSYRGKAYITLAAAGEQRKSALEVWTRPEFDMRIKDWRAAIFALAKMEDPSAGERVVDVMVQLQGDTSGLFTGLIFDAAEHTLNYAVDPATGQRDERHRFSFFQSTGVDPLVAARRVIRWMWERREYMRQRPSKAASMSTPQSLVRMAAVYMSWVIPTDIGDIKTWAKESLVDSGENVVNVGKKEIEKAFAKAARLEELRWMRNTKAADDAEWAALSPEEKARHDMADVMEEAWGVDIQHRRSREIVAGIVVATPDEAANVGKGASVDTDWSYATGPSRETLKKNRATGESLEVRMDMAMEGTPGYAQKNWPAVNNATINPVAWMIGVLT